MASEPKKDEATEAALEAVEKALNADFDPKDSGAPGSQKQQGRKLEPSGKISASSSDLNLDEDVGFELDIEELESSLANAANDLRNESNKDLRNESSKPAAGPTVSPGAGKPRPRLPSAPTGAKAPRSRQQQAAGSRIQPANDDDKTRIMGVLASMQQRPSNATLWTAAVLSVVWIGIAIAYFALGRQNGEFLTATTAELITKPSFMMLAVMTVIPVLLIWAFAILVRRAQEMRSAARSMTEAAIRLLQPEQVASESVAAIGSAVRREVAAIGDGMERALARASELEQMVQNEVNSLERSYSDSEIRLRSLIKELSSERGEILNHAEKLRESLTYTHSGLTSELDQVSGRIKNSIDQATSRMSDALNSRHETITASLAEAGDNLSLLLTSSGVELESKLANATDTIRSTVAETAAQIGSHVSMVGKAVASLLDTRSANIRELTDQTARQIEDAIDMRTSEFASRINDAGETLHLGLDSRLDNIENLLANRGGEFVTQLDMKTEALNSVFERQSIAMGDVISKRLAGFGQSLTSHVDSAVETLNSHRENLETTTGRVENTISEYLNRFDNSLKERVIDISKSFNEGKDILASTFDAGLNSVSTKALEAKLSLEEIQSAFSAALDDRIGSITESLDSGHQRFVSEFDRMSERSAGIVTEIDGTAQNLGEVITKASDSLDSTLQQHTAGISEALDQRAKKIKDAMAERAGMLQSSMNEGHQLFVDELDRLEERSQLLLSEIEKRSQVLGSSVSQEGAKLANLLDLRTGAIQRSMVEGHTFLADELEKMDQRSQALAAEISKRSGAIGSIVDEEGNKLAALLDLRTGNIQRSMLEGHTFLADELEKMDQRSQALAAEISKRSGAIGSIVDEEGNKLAASLENRTAAIHQALAEGHRRLLSELDKMENRSAGIVAEFDKRAELMGAAVNEETKKLEDALEDRTVAIQQALAEGHSRLVSELDKMDNRSTGLVAEIDKRTQKMGEVVIKAGGGIASLLDERTSAIQKAMAEGRNQFLAELDKMDDRGIGLVSDIEKRTKRIGEIVAALGGEMNRMLLERTTDIQRSLIDGQQNLLSEFDKMNDHGAGLISEIEKRTDTVRHIVSQATEEFAGTFAAGAEELQKRLKTGQGVVSLEFESGTRKIVESIEAKQRSLANQVSQTIELTGQHIDQKADSLNTLLTLRAEEINKALGKELLDTQRSLESKTQEFSEILGQRTKQLSGLVEQNTGIISDIEKRTGTIQHMVAQASQKFVTAFEAGAADLQARLESGHGIIVQEFDTGARLIAESIEEKQRSLAEQVSESIEITGKHIDQKADSLNALLSERAQDINKTLGNELLQTQRELEEKTRSFSEALAERVQELSGILAEKGTPIISGIRSEGDELVAQIESVATTLASDISSLLSVLGQTARGLESAVDITGDSVKRIENNIVDGTLRLQEAVEKANIQAENTRQTAANAADSLNESVEYLSKNVSGSAFRFDKHANQLFEAAENVTAAQKQLAAMLDSKQEPIEKLAHDLANRSVAIEASMTHFSEILSSLIKNMMKEANTAGAKINSELEASFNSAIQRLNETVNAMRGASEEIQRELEATREQVRRGVLELPEETRESADAMRRVVSDQIAALKDLSEIVAKSGRSFDTSVSALPQPRIASAGAIAGNGAPFQEYNIAPAPANVTHGRTGGKSLGDRLADPTPRDRGASQGDGPRTLEPAAMRSAPARGPTTNGPQAPQGRSSQAGQGGWVTDLLRRASAEPDDAPPTQKPGSRKSPGPTGDTVHSKGAVRSPMHVVESLNSLSMDIAKAIDHDTFIDLWDRYQRGERNIFTRRLYTLQGEQTFDEIKSKYSREPEFRSAVDRYIADFEKLLKDVSRGDRDNVMTQTYMTSDTGKVYTMLAHAAGKFGKSS